MIGKKLKARPGPQLLSGIAELEIAPFIKLRAGMITFHGISQQRRIKDSGIKGSMVAALILKLADEMEGRGTTQQECSNG